MARRPAIVLEVALIVVIAANALHCRQVVQPVAVLGGVGADTEVPDADLARVVTRCSKGSRQGWDVAKGLVLVVDHAIAPAVSTG